MVAFVASTVLTAAALNTAFNALTIRTVTLTSDTLVLADNGGAVTYSNASATTSTIPPNSSVAYAVGTKIILANLGAGVVTVTAGSGVTVNGTLTIAQNAGGTCLKTATNTWSFLPFGSAGAATLTSADVSSTTGSPTITTSGANTIYSFTGSGTLVTSKTGVVTALVLGGGGGGMGRGGGGGGAGGFLEMTGTCFLVSGTNTITVGAGGAFGEVSSGARHNPRVGAASQVGNYYSVGGGTGGSDSGDLPVGGYGGSGGGGGGTGGGSTGGAATPGLGNAGGNSLQNYAGGGGGANAVGVAAVGTVSGNGGAGKANSITGSSVTRGGGGGGGGVAGTAGTGGTGGGGNGTNNDTNAANGSANLGGGGGGGGQSSGDGADGGNGGSGVVIISVTT